MISCFLNFHDFVLFAISRLSDFYDFAVSRFHVLGLLRFRDFAISVMLRFCAFAISKFHEFTFSGFYDSDSLQNQDFTIPLLYDLVRL